MTLDRKVMDCISAHGLYMRAFGIEQETRERVKYCQSVNECPFRSRYMKYIRKGEGLFSVWVPFYLCEIIKK